MSRKSEKIFNFLKISNVYIFEDSHNVILFRNSKKKIFLTFHDINVFIQGNT